MPATASPPAPASAPTVRVVVIDEQPVVAEGVSTIVRNTGIAVVGVARALAAGRHLVARLRPHVVMVDVRVGDTLAAQAVGTLLAACPASRVVVFTALVHHPGVAAAVAAGAAGSLPKHVTPANLVSSIHAVAEGRPIARWAGSGTNVTSSGLSPREYEILRGVAAGRTNAEIAAELFLAPTTVKTYWQSALRKLRARNRAEAIMKAHGEGLL